MKKYEHWMQTNVLQDPEYQLGKCTTIAPEMQKAFPELVLRRGVVYSDTDPDNHKYKKEYPHMWLETVDGEVVDPTGLQFCLIAPAQYRGHDSRATRMHRCMNCGGYYTSYDRCQCSQSGGVIEEEFLV